MDMELAKRNKVGVGGWVKVRGCAVRKERSWRIRLGLSAVGLRCHESTGWGAIW